MYVILGVIIFFLFLVFWSALPLIKLKYHNDLAEYSDNITKHCYKNIDIDYFPEKHKYMFHICTYLFDDEFKETTKIKDESVFRNDNKGQPEWIYMNFYREYTNASMPLFVLGLLFLMFYVFLFQKYFSYEYVSYSLLYVIIFIVLLFIIIFSLILKKITEIYNDTKLYKYYNLLATINQQAMKYKTIKGAESQDFKNFVKTVTYDAETDDNYAKNIIINDETITVLNSKLVSNISAIDCVKSKSTGTICNTTDLSELLDMHSYIHSKKHTDEVKYRINTVTSFLYAYVVFAFVLIYFLFKILNELIAMNMVYFYAYIVISYLLLALIYLIIITLQ